MKNVKINIWGREFNLPVEFDVYDNESITSIQTEAVKRFISNKDNINSSIYEVVDYCSKKESKRI